MPERKLSRRQMLIRIGGIAGAVVGTTTLATVLAGCDRRFPVLLESLKIGESVDEISRQVTITNGGKSNLKGAPVFASCDLYANRDTAAKVSEHQIYAGTIDNGVTLLTEGQINCRVSRRDGRDTVDRFYVVSQEELARLVEADLFHFPRGATGSYKRLTEEKYYLRSENIELPK